MSVELKIYVSVNCWGCIEARKLYDSLRVEFSEASIELIERTDANEDDWPEAVIAVPAYLLNGKVVSLGNPTAERIHDLLTEAQEQYSTRVS